VLYQDQDVDAALSNVSRVIGQGLHQTNAEPSDSAFFGPAVQVRERRVERIERGSLVAESNRIDSGEADSRSAISRSSVTACAYLTKLVSTSSARSRTSSAVSLSSPRPRQNSSTPSSGPARSRKLFLIRKICSNTFSQRRRTLRSIPEREDVSSRVSEAMPENQRQALGRPRLPLP